MSSQYHDDLDEKKAEALREEIRRASVAIYPPVAVKVERTFPRGWIKLTSDAGCVIRVNTAAIICYGRDSKLTMVVLPEDECVAVKETPEEIDKLILQSQGDQ